MMQDAIITMKLEDDEAKQKVYTQIMSELFHF